MNINVKRFLSFLLAFAMVLSMVPGQAFHVHAEELVETHQHTVRFLDWDGTQLQSTAVDVGAVPEYTGEPLTRASDGTYEYTFTGWDADGDALADELAPVTADVDYVALYAAAAIAVVSEEEADPTGDAAESTPAESVPADTQVTEPVQSEPVVTEPAESTPAEEESSVVSQYAISFVDWDGTLLQEVLVNEGEVPVYTGAEPVVESDGTFEAHFAGWDVDGDGMYDEELDIIPPATADATYTAAYTVIELITPEEPVMDAINGTLSVEGLSAEYSNKKSSPAGLYLEASWSGTGTGISGSATGMTGRFSSYYITSTLKLTNNTGSKVLLKFKYQHTGSGSATVNGVDATTKTAEYSGYLDDAATINIVLTSPTGDGTANFLISDISLTTIQSFTTEFKPAAEGGSYKVDGTPVTGLTSRTDETGTEILLVATPMSDTWEFFGWETESGEYLSYDANYTLSVSANNTITAKFIKKGTALFGVGTKRFYDLNDAAEYASTDTAESKTIVLLNNGTLPAGNYTIPAGVTLLIPYNDENTAYGANAKCTSDNNEGTLGIMDTYYPPEAPRAYRTLTLDSGANITVNGNIEVGGRHAAAGGGFGYNCTPTGPLGYINMLSGSHIDLESGANLYAWGYIYGDGTITAKNGSTVYEVFQVTDFRGGTATTSLADDELAFPLNQYYVQNVEVATTYQYGAKEKVVLSVYMNSMHYNGTVNFIGAGALFQMGSESSYIVKDYIPSSDRLSVKAYGNCTFSSMNVSLAGVSVNSADFIMPITNNMEIEILSGSVITLKQDMMLLPGAKVTVCQGATFQLSSADTSGKVVTDRYALQVFSGDNWKWGLTEDGTLTENLCFTRFNAKDPKWVRPVPATAEGKHKIRTDADACDVVVDIQGTVIADGHLYTTVTKADYLEANPDTPATGGARIISSTGTGVIQMNGGSGTDTFTKMYSQDVSVGYYDIPLASVQLTNGDGTYLDTSNSAAGATYNYCDTHDMWYIGECKKCKCGDNHTWGTGEETTTPTCTAAGVKTFTCTECGTTKTEPIAALGHTPGAAATCTSAQTCTVCGTELKAALGHAFNSKASANQAKAADCLNAATYYVQCDRCSAVSDSKTVAVGSANGHSYNAKASNQVHTAGTCMAETVYYVQCDNCTAVSDTVTVKGAKVPTNHTGKTTTVGFADSTCTKEGYTGDKVCECGTTVETGTAIAMKNHTPGEAATCTTAQTCTVCGTELTPAKDHAWTVSYDWSADGKSCTAKRTCGNDAAHNLTETVTATGAVKTPATCTEKGTTTYTATFSATWATPQTKDVQDIAVIAHSYGTKQSTSLKTAATCEGNAVYYVQCENCSAVSDSVTVEAPNTALGHNWGTTEYTWTGVTGCTATHTCTRDDSHKETATATISSKVTTPATCTEKGTTTYTATFSATWAENQTKDVQDIDVIAHSYGTKQSASLKTAATCEGNAVYYVQCENCSAVSDSVTVEAPNTALGHNWGTTEYTWTGVTGCTATHTCTRDDSHKETATATISSEVTTPATCTVKGTTTYTATFDNVDWATTQTKDVQDIPATDHAWGAPSYKDNGDGTHTASYVCGNDKDHIKSDEAENHTYTYSADDAADTITETCDKVCGHSATITLKAPADLTFNGEAKAATTEGKLTGHSVMISYQKDHQSFDTAPVDAGTYTASIMAGDAKVEVTFTIAKADPAITTAPAAVQGLVYNGRAQALVTAGAVTGGQLQYMLEGVDWSNWSTEIPAVSNAGTFTVRYKVVGNDNYNASEEYSLTVTIAKAPSGVAAAPTPVSNLTYTGEARYLINEGETEDGTMVYSLTKDGEYTSDIPQATNAGTYTVYYKVKGDANHADSTVDSITATIAKAEPKYTEAPYPVGNLVYNGEPQKLVTAATSNDGEVQYSTDGETWSTTIPTATDAGTYTVYCKIVGDSNHNDSGIIKIEPSIAKADPTVTAPIADNRTYNGETKPLVTAGTTNGGTMVYSMAEDGTYDPDIPVAKNAGTYTVWYKVMGGDNYTDVAPQSIEVTIAQAPLTITAEDKTVCIGGAPELTWKVEGLMNGDTLSKDPTLTTRENCTATIGNYTITPSGAVADDNYDITYVNGTLTVNNHVFDKTTGACQTCQHFMAVASVTINGTTTYYETLDEAVTEAYKGTDTFPATLTLMADIDLGDDCLTISSGVFTLDLNGCELTSAADRVLYITGGDVAIVDPYEIGTEEGGIINTYTGTDNKTGAVYVAADGKVTVSNGAMITGKNNCGMYVMGTANIGAGATIKGDRCGVSVEGDNASALITGGKISGNTGVSVEGAKASVVIKGSTPIGGTLIDGDTIITGTACGVSVTTNATASIDGGTITGSTGVSVKGANASATIKGETTISSNLYGVYVENGKAIITGGFIKAGNSHDAKVGDGVYVNGGTAEISSFARIMGNRYGVSVEGDNASALITGGTILGTSADLYKSGGKITLTLAEGKTEGATFPVERISGIDDTFIGGITVMGDTLANIILGTGASYWAKVNEKDTMLTVDGAATEIDGKGDITVRATCDHLDTEKSYTDNKDGATHTVTCLNCQNVVDDKEAHGMIAATGECICGHDMAVASVTLGENAPTYFETLGEAVDAVRYRTAEHKAVVKLLKDISLNDEQVIESGVFTIDLNDHKIESTANQVLNITGGTVTIADSGENKTGTISGGTTATETAYGVYVNGGTAKITGGTIEATANYYAYGVHVNGGTANISGGTITATGTISGYGVYVNGGSTSVTITGGTIEATGAENACGVHVNGGTANISGGTITGGTDDTTTAYGVYVYYGGTATITGGTIEATATETAYGVYANQGEVTISGDARITAPYGVYLGESTNGKAAATIEGGTITSTYIDGYGVFVSSNSSAKITGGTIEAARYGVYVASTGTATITGGTITGDNYGVYVKDGTANISDTAVIEGTECGVYTNKGTVNISGGSITCEKNSIYSETGVVTITGGSITGPLVDSPEDNMTTLVLTLAEGKDEGATFPGGITVSNATLKDILGTGASYWAGNTMIMAYEDEYAIDGKGDITVRATCNHTGSQHTTITDNKDGTHTYTCTLCQNTITEKHIFDSTDGVCLCGHDMAVATVTLGENDPTYFETLNEAVTAVKDCTAEDKAVVKPLKDIDLGTTNQSISSGVFTLDLNGCKLESSAQYVLYITGGNVTITDSGTGETKGGIINTRTSKYKYGNGMYVTGGNSTVNITGGTITSTGAQYGNGVYVYNGGTANISGGTITATGTSFGYGVCVDSANASATITGGTIEATATETAYGVYTSGTATITGGTITSTGAQYGNGVYVYNGGTATITGGTITVTGSDGYGVYVEGTNASVTISGGKITAGRHGVYLRSGEASKVIIQENAEITGNKYGVYAEVGAVTVSGGTITGNESVGVHVRYATTTATISGGTITGKGSGVSVYSNGKATISGGEITGKYGVNVEQDGTANISGDTNITGGSQGVHVGGEGTANISGGTINGGTYGVYAYGTANISGGTIEAANFGVYGGVMGEAKGTVTITGGSISGSLDLCKQEGATVTLTLAEGKTVGATFPGGITVSGTTLAKILDDGASYWAEVDGKNTMVIPASDALGITDMGTITVKAACNHKDTEKGYTDNADGATHKVICQNCQNVVTAEEAHNYNAETYRCICDYDQHFTVTFHANGGMGTMDNQSISAVEATVLNGNTFTRTGYAFRGWATDPAATDALYTNGQAITLKEDTDLYAIWAAGKSNYTVEIYTMAVDGQYGDPESLTLSAETDSAITYTPEDKAGFTVDTEKSVLTGTATADEKTTLKVYYIRNEYTVTYKVDDKDYTTQTYRYGADVKAAKEPEKIGYTFSGWQGVPGTMPAKDVTVTGTFTANTYDATFHAGDGAWADGEKTKTVSTAFGSDIIAPTNPERKGYTFTGWTPEVGTMNDVNGKTFTAQWRVNSYEAVFDANGGAWTNGNTTETVITVFGTKIAAPAAPARTGYTFTGWDKEVGTMDEEGITFTAQWSANSYEAVFDANGGQWTDGESSVSTKTVPTDFDADIIAPADPVREGYTFAGWSPEVGKMDDVNGKTFTAQWKANSYDAVFDANGGQWTDGDTRKTVPTDFDAAIIAPAAPAREGYTFAGWDLTVGKMDDVNGITFTAQWTPNKYTVTWEVNGKEYAMDTVTYGETIPVPADPVRDQFGCTTYTFDKWDAEIPDTMPAQNLRFTAIFTEGENHAWSVRYDWSEDGKSCTATRVCGRDAEHNLTETVTATGVEKTPATCEDMGWTTYTATFNADWAETQTKDVQDIPALDHAWTVSYQWSDDGKSCIATRTCGNDATHIETATGKITSTVKTKATCTEKGWTTYTATFEADWAEDQTKDVQDIPALDHAWTVSYQWSDDGKSCTATRTCGNDAAHNLTATGKVTSTVKTKATCTEKGWTTYTATFEADWAEDQTKDVQDIPALDHAWTVSYQWSDDGKTCTATHVCGNDAAHNLTATGKITSTVKTKATCTEKGWTTYTATFEADWAEDQTKDVQDIPALDHAWTVSYQWSEDGKSCTATRVCGNDAAHNLTATGKVTATVKTEATCEDMGWTTYTATFNADWAETQTKDVQDIPALKHAWTVSYQWSDDGKTCTATRVCGNDAAHNLTATGKVTSVIKTEATCEDMGWTTYTATFDADWAETQTKDVQDIPALKHDWVLKDYTVTDETHTANYVCGNDSAHTKSGEEENHTYTGEDHKCICGAVEQITVRVFWQTEEPVWTLVEDYGTVTSIPTGPAPEGHSFAGFARSKGGEVFLTKAEYTYTESIDLYPVFTVNSYTVTFTVNGETWKQLTFPYGEAVTAPDYTVPAGHTFSGWTLPDTMPAEDITLDAVLTVNKYPISWDTDGDGTIDSTEDVAYGTVPTAPEAAKAADGTFTYTFSHWDKEIVAVTGEASYCAIFVRTGWLIGEEGRQYLILDQVQKTGWTEIGTDWYYLDPETGYAATGVSRVPYPATAIEGVTYAPAEEIAQDPCDGFELDKTSGLFLFDEETGRFQSETTGMGTWLDATRYAEKGHIAWHPGLVLEDGNYYYFLGDETLGGNILATGDVYMARNNTERDVVIGGIYTFSEEDGKLCEYDGITDVKGILRYYEDARLMIGNGLTKVGDEFIYVRYDGSLVVNNSYWVGTNDLGVAEGVYFFNENGFLVFEEVTLKEGVYREGDAWYYYEQGARVFNRGLIEVTDVIWHDADGSETPHSGIIYIRSNGKLVTGNYYITNISNYEGEEEFQISDYLIFDELGLMNAIKNGIYAERGTLYYYQNNVIAYNAGVIQLDGNYYYVRSNGEVVHGKSYWITNVGDSGVIARCYAFDDNGVMQNPAFVLEQGIVNGYYYINGNIAYGAGLVKLSDENGEFYIYVKSNGQLATGKYWPTTTNGYDVSGMLDFGAEGKYYI